MTLFTKNIGKLSFLLCVLLTVCGCDSYNEANRKLTIEVDTPNGSVTASGVSKFGIRKYDRLEQMTGSSHNDIFRGEAIPIKLDDGRYLFALEVRRDVLINVREAWGFEQLGINGSFDQMRSIQRAPGVREFRYPSFPKHLSFVTFDDLRDPSTVRRIPRYAFETVLGRGYKLKSVRYEITTDSVTLGKVEKVLDWIYDKRWPFPQETKLSVWDFVDPKLELEQHKKRP